MIFNDGIIFVYLKFVCAGLVLGIFYVICNIVKIAFKRNLYIDNIINLCFWLLFSIVLIIGCNKFNNGEFFAIGFALMLISIKFIQFCIEISFTKGLKLLYNKFNQGRKSKYGQQYGQS